MNDAPTAARWGGRTVDPRVADHEQAAAAERGVCLGDAGSARLERGDHVAGQHQVEWGAQVEAVERGIGRAERVVGQHGQLQPGRLQVIERRARVRLDGAVDHAVAFELIDDGPQLGGQGRIELGREVEPLGDGADARSAGGASSAPTSSRRPMMAWRMPRKSIRE